MSRFWGAYNNALTSQPLITKMITAGVLLASGDCIAQKVIEKREGFDESRTMRSAIFGLCLAGPMMHYWYGFLGGRIGGTGLVKGIKTMLVDQTCFAPVIIATFFTSQSLLEGKSVKETKEKLQKDYLYALKGNYVLWPAAQLINFTFIPSQYAVLYVSGVSVIWNSWICYVNATDHTQKKE